MNEPPNKERPVNIDIGRQLFVDDYLISRTDLKRTWHHPVKFEDNPVLKPETPWEINEGGNATTRPNGGGIWWDDDEKVFKLWYEGGWLHSVCYATSKDGIHWDRPELDVVPGTNIVLPLDNPCYRPDSWSVVRDPHTKKTDELYKLMLHRPCAEPRGAAEGVCCVSPDGIHWKEITKLGPSGDRSTLFYDPFREKWVYSLRSAWLNEGETKGRRNRMYYATDDFTKGHNLFWKGNQYSAEKWLQADDRDLIDPSVADPAIFPKTQLYCFDAVAYESLMLGLFEIFLGPENADCEKKGLPKITDIKFGFSRDGKTFYREDFEAAIASERWGSGKWDTGYVQPVSNGCVIVGDELWFYYGAFRGDPSRACTETKKYDWTVNSGFYANAATGIAKLRRDGFASLDGTGEVVTKPIQFSGEYLFVNVDAKNGAFAAELIDAEGNVVDGYAAADSRFEKVDSCKYRVTWKNKDRIDVFKWKGHRLRFVLENASFYSFWIALDETGASNGWLAGGGPGYAGLRDLPLFTRPEIPPVISAPDAVHDKATRHHEGIPSMAISPKGRMWATWYCSPTIYEDEYNYLVLSTSADGGKTWTEKYICDPDGDGPRRVFDPELWLAPDGKIRWTWTDKLGPCPAYAGNDQLWMAVLDPETGDIIEAPRVIAKGVMMCKPTVLADGTWIFPVAQWWVNPSACCYVSTDGGKTFVCRGGVRVPKAVRCFDEHSIIQKRNGDLKCYIRTAVSGENCLWSAESKDGGYTWTDAEPEPLASLSSRSFFTRLPDGNWLAVKHEGWRKWPATRSCMMALVSRDDGETWDGGVIIDPRTGCSYPDGCVGPDGRIYVISDYNRIAEREISFVSFTEDDILSFRSPSARQTISCANS